MMNEKIKELAKQAGYATEIHLSPRQGGATEEYIWGGVMETRKVEKFAELIVRECMALCLTSVGNKDYNTGRMHCHDNIEEYFGIK